MSTHRDSYRKTVVAAATAATIATAAAMFIPWLPARVLCAGSAVFCAMVAWGGGMCLRRDAGKVDEVRAVGGPPQATDPPRARGRSGTSAWFSRVRIFGLRVGRLVQVRTPQEILATLDERGSLDRLPFMPEMLRYCGSRFRVFRRVDKIWDRQGKTGLRRMRDVVLLDDLRCDGSGHAGCQAGCPILWKDAWLAPVTAATESPTNTHAPVEPTVKSQLDRRLAAGTRLDGERLHCQLTALPDATTRLARWDIRQDLRPLLAGNVAFDRWLRGVAIELFNVVQRMRGGTLYPVFTGGSLDRTPGCESNLEPGELVEVRSRGEIEETLDRSWKNRGMYFDVDMLRYCGKRYRVLARVDHLVDEFTGKIVHVRNPCVILDGVTATGEWHRFRAQNEYIFWREIWLRRVAEPNTRGPAPQ